MDADTERPQQGADHLVNAAHQVSLKLKQADLLQEVMPCLEPFLTPEGWQTYEDKRKSLIAEAEQIALAIHTRGPSKEQQRFSLMSLHVTHAICKSKLQATEQVQALAEEEGWSKEKLDSAVADEEAFAKRMVVYGVNFCQAALRIMKE